MFVCIYPFLNNVPVCLFVVLAFFFFLCVCFFYHAHCQNLSGGLSPFMH